MKIIPLPQDRAEQEKKARSLKAVAKGYNVCLLGLAIAAIACLVGVLVVVIMLETGESTPARDTLLYILAGSFAGGALLFAGGALLFGRLAQEATLTHRDFAERCCGENCFFVGDGTIAQFEKDCLLIRPEAGAEKGKAIRVPYREIRFHSVCTRTKPQEKGKWSVVIELPAHYVMKRGDAPRALIEADAKERLYQTLEACGLELLGEQPPRGQARANVRFRAKTKFVLPDDAKRRRCLLYAALGVALVVAGALIAVFWRDFMLVGLILSVFGLFFAVRQLIGHSRAKGLFALVDEGLYWRESGRPEADRFFLKWSELVHIKTETVGEKRYIAAECAYGTYHIPDIAGAYEALCAFRPELCGE